MQPAIPSESSQSLISTSVAPATSSETPSLQSSSTSAVSQSSSSVSSISISLNAMRQPESSCRQASTIFSVSKLAVMIRTTLETKPKTIDDLNDLIQQLFDLSSRYLTHRDQPDVFRDRMMAIEPLCRICQSADFPILAESHQVALLRVIHTCLDDYIYFQLLYPQNNPSITKKTRDGYLKIIESRSNLYQNIITSTVAHYELECIVEALKEIATEQSCWGGILEKAKKEVTDFSSLSSLATGLAKFALSIMDDKPKLWFPRVWAIRNFSRLLIAYPSKKEFNEMIGYIRFALEAHQGDWQVGYAVGEALMAVIKNCPVERLRSLAVYNRRDRENKIPAYQEKEAKVVAHSKENGQLSAVQGAVTVPQTASKTTEVKAANNSKEEKSPKAIQEPISSEAKEAKEAKKETQLSTQDSAVSETAIVETKETKTTTSSEEKQPETTKELLPFYVDLNYLLGQVQKKREERYVAFQDDRALYSAVQGMFSMCATSDSVSWDYYFASQQLETLLVTNKDSVSWFKGIVYRILGPKPSLRKLLDQYGIQIEEAKQTATHKVKEPVARPAVILPFTDAELKLVEIQGQSLISTGLNIACSHYQNQQRNDFVGEMKNLMEIYAGSKQNFSQAEIQALYTAAHALARIYLSEGNRESAQILYATLTSSPALAQKLNFHPYAGDSYLLQALVHPQGYFDSRSLSYYEQALIYFLKDLPLERETTPPPLANRIAYLMAQVDSWHIVDSLQQEIRFYQANPHERVDFPLEEVMQRIGPLMEELLEFKADSQVSAVYQLLAPAIHDFVQKSQKKKEEGMLSRQDYLAMESIAQQLWQHQQNKLAVKVYEIGLSDQKYNGYRLACLRQESCTLERSEWKETGATIKPNLSEGQDLSLQVLEAISTICKQVATILGNPFYYRWEKAMEDNPTPSSAEALSRDNSPQLPYDILVYGRASQGTLQWKDKIHFVILVDNEEARLSHYFRDFLALVKIRLQLAFHPHFDFDHLQYPDYLAFIKTPDELFAYSYETDAKEQPKLLTDREEARYCLLKPTVVYSNNNQKLSTAYVKKVTAKTELNRRFAIEFMRRHVPQDSLPRVFLEHFIIDLALYYSIPDTHILDILAQLKNKQYFVPAFIDQLAIETQDGWAGKGEGYLVPVLPTIASLWIQNQIPSTTFDPMLLAWEMNYKNIGLKESMVVALAEYLGRHPLGLEAARHLEYFGPVLQAWETPNKNLRLKGSKTVTLSEYLASHQLDLDLAVHLQYFQQVPTHFKRRPYFATLRRAFANAPSQHQAKATAILDVLAEQQDECGRRIDTVDQQLAFAQVLQQDLTLETKELQETKEQKDPHHYVLMEWMEGSQKVQRLLKPEVVEQLLDEKGQPDRRKKMPDGKRTVILVKANQGKGEGLAYFKFYPERPGVQMQTDALTRRIVGYALHWKLCRMVVVQGQKKTTYPVMVSAPAGISLKDICNHCVPHHDFKSTCEHLDKKAYSLMMISRIIMDPEDDQFSNFVVQKGRNHQLKEVTRLVCVDGDHAFDEAFAEGGKVNLKSYLFCMDEMLQPVDPRAVEEFGRLKVYSLLFEWIKELAEYDKHHIGRTEGGLFSLMGDPSEAESYFKPILEAKESEVPSTYIPSMVTPRMVRGLFQKIVQIQDILSSTPNITHLDLLFRMDKELAEYYQKALALKKSPWERFESLPHNYDTPMTAASNASIVMHRKSTIQNIRFVHRSCSSVIIQPAKTPSISDLFKELKQPEYFTKLWGRLEWELTYLYGLYQEKYLQLALLNGNFSIFDSLKEKDGRVLQHVINNLDFSRVEAKNEPNVEKFLQKMVGIGFDQLRLAGCQALNDQLLCNILAASKQMILNLDVSHCPKLTTESLANIAKHCPHLRKLNLSHTSIEYIENKSWRGIINPVVFPELVNLIAENCVQLTQVNLTAPNLRRLRLANDRNLETLRTNDATTLSFLDLQDCEKVLHRQMLTQYPFLASYDLKDARTQYDLGCRYENGRDRIAKDEKEAVSWYRKAAEQGYAEAQNHLGTCYYSGTGVAKDEKEAASWFRKAAEQGHVIGQNSLGVCYQDGTGVAKGEKEAVNWYRKAVEQGYVEAQNNLGFCYQNGIGVTKDEKEAVSWYRKAAEQGLAAAQNRLGVCYQDGKGVAKDEKEAVNWYGKAVEQGHAAAQINLGTCYRNGKGVEKDEKEAVGWYRKAAEQGYAEAQNLLGNCYYSEVGVAKDEKEAVSWYRKAAEQGHAEAQNLLGNCYYFGAGVAKDEKEAVSWYRKAAEQGHAAAQNNLGVCYQDGKGVAKDEKEAVSWYRKAAEQGQADAQGRLGTCYRNGTGVEKDEKEAVSWYRKAAEQMHANAQNNLGVCYQDGKGVAKDEKEAVSWYRKAAEQGHAAGQNNLASCYYSGKGVAKDEKEAVNWFLKAAEQGYATVQNNLGRCYENGTGVIQDEKEAVKWYRKAAKQGNAVAQNNLGRFYQSGKGITQDIRKAVTCYRMAAKQGNADAQYNLGFCYQHGIGVIKSEMRAMCWYKTAAENGDAEAQYYLGNYYENEKGVVKDEKEAVKWYRKAAVQGHADAQYRFGFCHENGKGVAKDEKEAVEWYRKAAKQKNNSAQYQLGNCYYYGRGVTKDEEKATDCYFEAAWRGNAHAYYSLGECYENGKGVKKNEEEAVKWYRRAADDQWNVSAQYRLGLCYQNGKGVEKDEKEAVKWYRKAASQGNADAQTSLGGCYEYGKGVTKDEKEAVKLYRKAAEQGNTVAQYNLGFCYYHEIGVEKNEAIAVSWYKKAAKQGDTDARYELEFCYKDAGAQQKLGDCYYYGKGVAKDEKEAVSWYQKAAEQGNADAQQKLGDCYYYGVGVAEDKREGVRWYLKAAWQGNMEAQKCLTCKREEVYEEVIEQAIGLQEKSVEIVASYLMEDEDNEVNRCRKAGSQGNAYDQNWLGVHYEFGMQMAKDEKEAVSWYRKAVDQGNADAQYNLGRCYGSGTGVTEDEKEAVKLYRKAAEQGHVRAQYALGFCYDMGTGVDKDEKEAVSWYRKAAEQGDETAQYNLGRCYCNGTRAIQDPKEAVGWYQKSAEQGHVGAQIQLGFCYEHGIGVTKDEKEGVSWYRKAADKGIDTAQNNLGRCYEHGTGVVKDEKEAVSWYRKAAELGHASAQNNLGQCYENGKGVVKDEREAVSWYRKGADQGCTAAQNNLGVCYEYGNGVEKDEKEAVNWYQKAAEHVYAAAQDNLGRCYENGIGVVKDEKEAVDWYWRAAVLGLADAQYRLGLCYKNGVGVAKNLLLAEEWCAKATAQDETIPYKEAIKTATALQYQQLAIVISYLMGSVETKSSEVSSVPKKTIPARDCQPFMEAGQSQPMGQQVGWNCFDLAVGLAEALEIKETVPEERAIATRKALVQYALAHSSHLDFRRLLAAEIRHTAGATAVYLNQKDNQKEDAQQLAQRNAEIMMLFQQAEASTDQAIKEFLEQEALQLIDGDGDEPVTSNLRAHILPPSMRLERVQKLVNNYQEAHNNAQMRSAVATCNQALGRQSGQYWSVEQLQQFFENPSHREQYPQAYQAWYDSYRRLFVPHENALREYCEAEATYHQYLEDYYGKKGWFAFQRSFTGEQNNTSMIDIAARCINAQILVYQKDSNGYQELFRTQPIGKKIIYVQYNGHNHFFDVKPNPAHRMTVETTLAISFFRANATKKSEEEIHFCKQNLGSLLSTVQNFLY